MLLRIFAVVFALLFLPALYMCIAHFRHNRRKVLALCVLNAALFVYMAAVILFFPFNAENGSTIGSTLLPVYALGIGQCAFALFAVGGRIISKQGRIRRIFLSIGCASAIGVIATFAYGYFIGRNILVVTSYDYHSPRLPDAFDGYRIVQLTDLHLNSFYDNPEYVDRMVDSTNAASPDLIAITGDIVSFSSEELARFLPALSRLRAKDGIISIMGNHDYGTYTTSFDSTEWKADTQLLQQMQSDMGWTLLLNSHIALHRGSDSIVIEGTENSTRQKHINYADIDQTIKGVDSTAFQIMLTHDPRYWKTDVLPRTHADLTLAGHLHGFQYLLFGLSPSILFSPHWRGAYTIDHRTLYVSMGVGTSAIFPVRYGAWPEINVITLKRKS